MWQLRDKLDFFLNLHEHFIQELYMDPRNYHVEPVTATRVFTTHRISPNVAVRDS